MVTFSLFSDIQIKRYLDSHKLPYIIIVIIMQHLGIIVVENGCH